MRQHLRWRVGLAVVVAGLGAAAWWVTPLFGSGAGQQIACSQATPPLAPAEPLEMNSVLAGPLFKTVVMEKEVFVCRDDAGTITQIHDLETFIEIVERPNKGGARPVAKRVEIATCTKDFVQDRVTCSTQDLPLQSAPPSLQGCRPSQEQPPNPRDPVAMNTVNSKTNVKTIKVEKEILDCPALGATADLYLFTEISEAAVTDAGGNVLTLRPVKKAFEGVKCLKELGSPRIRECKAFTPATALPAPVGTCGLAAPPLLPEEPLELNSVLAGPLFKTVAMEKEVFVCGDPGGGIAQIHDVETFIEIVERPDPAGSKPVEKRVEVATCVKDFAQDRVSCAAQNLDLVPAAPTLQGCKPTQNQSLIPRDPVEMNTVNSGTNVKTIKVEKEVLDCPDATADLYLFTEISESAVRDSRGKVIDITPVAKGFEGIKCLKNVNPPRIRQCHSFTPTAG